MKKLKKNDKGFTLVELIVVIAILAVLVTLIVPRILGNVTEARRGTDSANARTLASEITVWNAKQPTNTTWIKDGCAAAAANNMIDQAEYETHLDLPDGVTWPASGTVKITVDGQGNAAVEVAATPTP